MRESWVCIEVLRWWSDKPNSVLGWSLILAQRITAGLIAVYPGYWGGQPIPCLTLLWVGFAVPSEVTLRSGGLLPHLFTLTRGNPRAVCFLWHFPGVTPSGCYPAPCPAEFGLSSFPGDHLDHHPINYKAHTLFVKQFNLRIKGVTTHTLTNLSLCVTGEKIHFFTASRAALSSSPFPGFNYLGIYYSTIDIHKNFYDYFPLYPRFSG